MIADYAVILTIIVFVAFDNYYGLATPKLIVPTVFKVCFDSLNLQLSLMSHTSANKIWCSKLVDSILWWWVCLVYLSSGCLPCPAPDCVVVHGSADHLCYCQQKGTQTQERLWLPPGHVDSWTDGWCLFSAGPTLVCSCHCSVSWPCGQSQGGQWDQCSGWDANVCWCQRTKSDGNIRVYLDRIICQTCSHSQVYSNAGPIRCSYVHGCQYAAWNAVHWPMYVVPDASQAPTWHNVSETCSFEEGDLSDINYASHQIINVPFLIRFIFSLLFRSQH